MNKYTSPDDGIVSFADNTAPTSRLESKNLASLATGFRIFI